MTPAPHKAISISPPLVVGEIAFLSAFARDGSVVRRFWPDQPRSHCPWRPRPDGLTLELDAKAAAGDPDKVADWLRFLVKEFLAPSSARALTAALAEGLRGGHVLNGRVVVDGIREISIANNRTSERVISVEQDAVVLHLDSLRRPPRPGIVRTGARLRPSGPRDDHTRVDL